MTVQPTHQSADGRKFVKVADLPIPDERGYTVAWQDVNARTCHRGHHDSVLCGGYGTLNDTPLTPIPQPDVRWIGVNGRETSFCHPTHAAARAGVVGCEYLIRIETLNGVRTASVEEA